MLLDVKNKFIKNNIASIDAYTFIYLYNKPKYHISCDEYYKYCETQKLIKLNEPLYFYHLVDKSANLEKGLLSLQYMYDNQLYELFDKSTEKYKNRIISDWNIPKFKNKTNLTRAEIIDALNIFRGEFGTSYIYFFKYPPTAKLGKNMANILKYKNIYRININDEGVQRIIKDIFYGYEDSHSDNKKLDLNYYKTITEEEYFSKYDDNLKMNFSKLNHISIAFKDNYCPSSFLKCIDIDKL